MRRFNPPQHTDIIEWPFRSHQGESDPFDVLKDLREGFREYEEQPWIETVTLDKITQFSTQSITPEMMWLCGSWRLPETMSKCNGQAKKYINPGIDHDYYSDISDSEKADWVRTGIRNGLSPQFIRERAGLDAEEDLEEWCGRDRLQMRVEQNVSQMVLGRTWEHLLEGYHPKEHRDTPQRSFDEIAEAWNWDVVDVKLCVQYYRSNSHSLSSPWSDTVDGTTEMVI